MKIAEVEKDISSNSFEHYFKIKNHARKEKEAPHQ